MMLLVVLLDEVDTVRVHARHYIVFVLREEIACILILLDKGSMN